jgi:hypothetical protein
MIQGARRSESEGEAVGPCVGTDRCSGVRPVQGGGSRGTHSWT